MATVGSVYQTICWVLLEDTGLKLGIVTDDKFLAYVSEVVTDFLNRTRLVKTIFTQQINLGVGQYIIPEDLAEVEDVFVGGRLVERTTLEQLGYETPNWRTKIGPTRAWHVDGLPFKTIEITPLPYWQGAEYQGPQAPFGKYGDFWPDDRNLTLVGPASTTVTLLGLGDTLPVVPDPFSIYIGYGTMAKIFSDDAESKDIQRAAYCGARYEEAISIAKSISTEFLGDEFGED